jgi:hypothetical protein
METGVVVDNKGLHAKHVVLGFRLDIINGLPSLNKCSNIGENGFGPIFCSLCPRASLANPAAVKL